MQLLDTKVFNCSTYVNQSLMNHTAQNNIIYLLNSLYTLHKPF